MKKTLVSDEEVKGNIMTSGQEVLCGLLTMSCPSPECPPEKILMVLSP